MNSIENESSITSWSRKEELLLLARKSRARWVLDAASTEMIEKIIASTKNSSASQSSHTLKSKSRLPEEECIQDILNFLSFVADDGSYVDVDTILNESEFIALTGNDSRDTALNILSRSENTGLEALSETFKDNIADFRYLELLDRLRRTQCFEIVKSIQQFVAKFNITSREKRNHLNFRHNENDYLEWSDNIWKFIENICQQIRSHALWSQESDATWASIQESVERFIFTKLHPYIFNSDSEDIYLNQRLKDRVVALRFITPEHLDIKTFTNRFNSVKNIGLTTSEHDQFRKLLDQPVRKLSKLNYARNPFEMLSCIRETSASITALHKEYRSDKSLPGADEFLPMLILSIISSDLKHIHSIIKYLQRFIHPSKLMSEAGYLLTHFVSAVHFLENVDAKALTIDPEEFNRSIERCQLEAKVQNEEYKKSRTKSKSYSNEGGNFLIHDGNSSDTSANQLGAADDETILSMIEKSLVNEKWIKEAPIVKEGSNLLHTMYQKLTN